jgi:8-oxo-dGTP pyrophosphatase MutT (NUDIX family)
VAVRQVPGDIEVLMMERPARGFFGGLWVFPGGGVEEIDDSALARRVSEFPADVDDQRWRIAALRETIEEVGLAITRPGLVEGIGGVGEAVFSRLADLGVRLDAARLRLLSQWVTPVGAPTRFDARFYLTVVDGDPPLATQPEEVMAVEWTTPNSALRRFDDGEWAMVTPTLHHLRWLAGFQATDEVWEAAAEMSGRRIEPVLERDGSEVRVRLPADVELP